jgi:outer membrane protein
MKQMIVALSIMILFFGLNSTVFCAESTKIGVINFQKILQDSSAGKMTQKEIKAKGEGFQKTILAEKKILDEMKKNFEREALVLSPEKQQEKQREFRIKVNDFKKMQQNFQTQFKQLEIKKLNEIQNEVFKIADKIGKKENFSLILEKKASGIVYHPGKSDITDQVIKEYNLEFSKAN